MSNDSATGSIKWFANYDGKAYKVRVGDVSPDRLLTYYDCELLGDDVLTRELCIPLSALYNTEQEAQEAARHKRKLADKRKDEDVLRFLVKIVTKCIKDEEFSNTLKTVLETLDDERAMDA